MLKLGGLAISISVCLHSYHSGFAIRIGLYRKRGPSVLKNAWRSLGILIRHYTMTEGGYYNAARTMA